MAPYEELIAILDSLEESFDEMSAVAARVGERAVPDRRFAHEIDDALVHLRAQVAKLREFATSDMGRGTNWKAETP